MPSLNPLKAIEELIVEHGSSVIQGKHIALLREQLSILKEQFTVLERENAHLKSENEKLKAKTEKAKDVGIGLAPILEALHTQGPSLSLSEICEFTKIDRDTVEHRWAGLLESDGFVSLDLDDMGSLLSFTILPSGRTAWVRHRDQMKAYGQ